MSTASPSSSVFPAAGGIPLNALYRAMVRLGLEEGSESDRILTDIIRDINVRLLKNHGFDIHVIVRGREEFLRV